ncbi:MAG: hypothetical protein ACRENH_17375 [Gemmatimonadaceae bacterium]
MAPTAVPFADLEDAAARFVACRIPKAEWTHLAHLAIGTWHVQMYGPNEALTRLRDGIRRLNDSHGTPNTETSGYHETVTRAYVEILSQFLEACPRTTSLAERVALLVAGPLADRNVLLRFYSKNLLMSALARAEWTEPDVAPLELAHALG